jgi:X-X-X-Leu-X-X-Gly heptad repeat protein
MVTTPAPNATRAARPLHVLEHLEHAASDATGSRRPTRESTPAPQFSQAFADQLRAGTDQLRAGSDQLRGGSDDEFDPERVARAVEDLLRAIAPALRTRVQVEIIRPAATSAGGLSGGANGLSAVPADDLVIDVGARMLTVDGETVALTRREFDLLAYLERRRGVALSRRELMTSVWLTGYLEGDRTVDVHVRRIRMKLGRHAYRLSTLRGYGYRLD